MNTEKESKNLETGGLIRIVNPVTYLILVLIIIFFLYQVLGGFFAYLSIGDDFENNIPMVRVIISFGQFMMILAPTILFARLQTSDLKGMFRLRIPDPFLLFLSILAVFLIQPFIQGYLYFQDELINNLPVFQSTIKQAKELFDSLEKTTMSIARSYNIIELLIVTFVICVTPAICEEFLFRGFVLKNIEKVTKPIIAIIFSGFLFGVYHFQPFNIIPLLILGSFLGFIVYYTNSLYTGIMAHFLNNFFSTYLLYKFGTEDIQTPKLSSSDIMDTLIFSFSSIILFVIVLYLIYKIGSKKYYVSD